MRALDFGWERSTPFLAMDYAPGGTTRRAFPLGFPQPISRILPIVLQITDGLQYVHDRHIIHCDIKPENILIGPRNEVWIGDFGIATTATQASGRRYGKQEVRGTCNCMAPEMKYWKRYQINSIMPTMMSERIRTADPLSRGPRLPPSLLLPPSLGRCGLFKRCSSGLRWYIYITVHLCYCAMETKRCYLIRASSLTDSPPVCVGEGENWQTGKALCLLRSEHTV